jgi:P27 family predicted phage terminase small subunit
MSGPARSVWKRIVKSLPHDSFSGYHLDLLRAYCEAAARNKEASRHITKEGAVIKQDNGIIKTNPWCAIETQTSSTLASLGTKLGITRNSRPERGGKNDGLDPEKAGKGKFKGLLGGTEPNQRPRPEDGSVH